MFFINHTEIADGSAAIIEIDGPLNSETAPDFDDYISNLVDKNIIYLLVDMLNLKFISSEGIGAALMIQKSISEKNGLAVFFNINNEISLLFKLLGFDKVLTTASDRADALNILDRRMELSPPEAPSQKIDITENTDSSFFDDDFAATEFTEPEQETFDLPDTFDMPENYDTPDDEKQAFEPFIIECIKCRSLIRIKESGAQLCPFCSAEFTVNEGKKAVFKIKEIH